MATATVAPTAPWTATDSPMRIVLDTNTVLALWHFADPVLEPLRHCCAHSQLLANEATLDELARVLAYPVFQLSPEQIQQFWHSYRERVLHIGPVHGPHRPLPVCKDRDDQKFMELARDGAAQVLLTRDKALLKLARRQRLQGRFTIHSPEQFLLQLQAQ